MPDQDGYPTRAELRKLRALANGPDQFEAVMAYLQTIWWHPAWGITRGKRLLGRRGGASRRYRRYRVSTGGWSGNEEIISVLERTFFWMVCWQSSRRGGHYVLDVPQ